MAREEAMAPNTAMLAAMNKNKQKTGRNRDDADVRFGLAITDCLDPDCSITQAAFYLGMHAAVNIFR
jgi:hypothetical protein